MRVCLCLCVGDGEQVDRELDRDHRDHGVRELDRVCRVGYACVCRSVSE